MDGKEAIKQSIIVAAEESALRILSNAKVESDEKTAAAQEQIRLQTEEAMSRAEKKAEEIRLRGEMLANLDAKKETLRAKRRLVDEVYVMAAEIILSDLPRYKEFVAELIRKNADKGDKVVVAERDKKTFTADWLKGVRADVELSEETHSEIGGVILRGDKFDKKLTLPSLVGEVRETTESEVVKRLFV